MAVLVPINEIQAAIISFLKSDSTLAGWLAAHGGAGEIREMYWQGLDFAYPAVRVGMGTQVPVGEPKCLGRIPFTVASYTEGDSSLLANQLASVVAAALDGHMVHGTGWRSGLIITDSIIQATFSGQRTWVAISTFRMLVYYD